jgi:hypothetical protein
MQPLPFGSRVLVTGPDVQPSSPRSERRSRFDVVGRDLRYIVALSHDAVTSDLAIAREQLSDLLQRLLVVALTVPIRLAFHAHGGTTSFERI